MNPDGFQEFAPRDKRVIPPGVYLLFIDGDDIRSEGKWIAVGLSGNSRPGVILHNVLSYLIKKKLKNNYRVADL